MVVIEESISHAGAPFRVELAQGDGGAGCALLDHIPHNDASSPTFGDENTWTRYKISVPIPDVACTGCTLRLANPMTDKIPAGTTCSDPGTCASVYHSCAQVTVTGATPFAEYECPATPPEGWPFLDPPNTYATEAALWTADGWLADDLPLFKQDVGVCAGVAADPAGAVGMVTVSVQVTGVTSLTASQQAAFRTVVADQLGVDAAAVSITSLQGLDGAVDITFTVTPDELADSSEMASTIQQGIADGTLLEALQGVDGMPSGLTLSIIGDPTISGVSGDPDGDAVAGARLSFMGSEAGGWVSMFLVMPFFLLVAYACARMATLSLRAAFSRAPAEPELGEKLPPDALTPGMVHCARVRVAVYVHAFLAFWLQFWTWGSGFFSWIFCALAIYGALPRVFDWRLVGMYGAWACVWFVLTFVHYVSLSEYNGLCDDAGEHCANLFGDYCSFCGYVKWLFFVVTLQMFHSALAVFACVQFVRYSMSKRPPGAYALQSLYHALRSVVLDTRDMLRGSGANRQAGGDVENVTTENPVARLPTADGGAGKTAADAAAAGPAASTAQASHATPAAGPATAGAVGAAGSAGAVGGGGGAGTSAPPPVPPRASEAKLSTVEL